MKKLLMILSLILLVSGCTQKPVTPDIEPSEDALAFKEEYESYNDQTVGDSSQKYKTLDIEENNPIKYADFDEILALLDSGTGVIYFGYPTCPWCRSIMPVLLEVAKEQKIETIYYFNAQEIRNELKLENDTIVVKKEGTEEYRKLLERLDAVLDPYDGLNDPTIKRLYFPTVVFVRDGEVLHAQISSVASHTDPYAALTKEQHDELFGIYDINMEEVMKEMCKIDTKC